MVASNGDVMHNYRDLLGHTARGQSRAKSLDRKRWSMSLFVLHFGLREAPKDIAHHTILFGPRYKELVNEIFKGPKLAEDFSLYLHSPCTTDPDMAPPGMSTHYVLAPVPHLGRAEIDWAVEGPRYADRILASLEERLIPNLRAGPDHDAHLHARRFRQRTERPSRQRLLGRADPDAIRVVPAAQPRQDDPQLLSGRRGHPSGRGNSGRRGLGQGHGTGDAVRPGGRMSDLVLTIRPSAINPVVKRAATAAKL